MKIQKAAMAAMLANRAETAAISFRVCLVRNDIGRFLSWTPHIVDLKSGFKSAPTGGNYAL